MLTQAKLILSGITFMMNLCQVNAVNGLYGNSSKACATDMIVCSERLKGYGDLVEKQRKFNDCVINKLAKKGGQL